MGKGPLVTAPFQLISDDRTVLTLQDRKVIMTAPSAIAGKLEVRGVGITDISYAPSAELCLIARLTDADVERFPELKPQFEGMLGQSIPLIQVRGFEASAPIKLAIALNELKVLKVN